MYLFTRPKARNAKIKMTRTQRKKKTRRKQSALEKSRGRLTLRNPLMRPTTIAQIHPKVAILT